MQVQMRGYKIETALESIIGSKEVLHSIHGYEKSEKIVKRAKAMLALLTSSYTHFNLAHNAVFLDPDDHAFIKEHECGA